MTKLFHMVLSPRSVLICAVIAGGVIMAAYGCAEQTKVGFRLDDTDVPSAVFTPDGKYIVAGGFRRISLLDVATHKLIDRFPEEKRGHFGTRACQVIAVSPDGKLVASVSGWRPVMSVQVWDFQTGRLVRSFDTDRTNIHALAFSPDGTRLAAGTGFRIHDGPKAYEGVYEIWLWNTDKEVVQPIRLRGHEAPVQGIVFLPDGKRMVSAGYDWTLRLWDVATQQELKRSGPPKAIRPPPAGTRFGGLDPGATSWIPPAPTGLPLTISADGKSLVRGGTVWDATTLSLKHFYESGRLWSDFEEWRRFRAERPFTDEERQRVVFGTFVAGFLGFLTPDGKRLVLAGVRRATDTRSEIFVFDVNTGNLLFEDQVFRSGASVFALDVSPDGRYALAAGDGVGAAPGGALAPCHPNQLYLYRLPPPSSGSEPPHAEQPTAGEAAPKVLSMPGN